MVNPMDVGAGMCKVFGIRCLPCVVGEVSKPGFDLFPLQPRRGVISVEPLWTPTQNPVGVTSTALTKYLHTLGAAFFLTFG